MTSTQPTSGRPLLFGEALPLLHVNSNRNERFALGSLAGRNILVCAIKNADDTSAKVALSAISPAATDESTRVCAVFSVGQWSPELEALKQKRLVFEDAEAADKCGLFDPREPPGRWILFDPSLRVVAVWKLEDAATALRVLDGAPRPDVNAPILVVDKVFEPAFCARLIQYFKDRGSESSGITQQDPTGRTFVKLDEAFKRRSDCLIEEAELRDAAIQRLYWRLAPMIERAFMWKPTRVERYLVAAYDAENGGFFRPHRDNTTKGTAHRRFAVTINLNTDEYDGGDLRFPEFGPRTYRAPTGGAVVFSCAILHEATPVTRGTRYAFLPFLYDDAAAKVREANNKFLDESLQAYRET